MKSTLFFTAESTAESANQHAIPTRSEVAVSDTWNLAPLYASDDDWQAAFVALQKEYGEVAQFKSRVGESATSLLATLEFGKKIELKIERLGHYAMLRMSENAADSANLARAGQFENLMTKIGEANAFVTPEIQAIDDAQFSEFLAKRELSEWRVTLEKVRRLRLHTLSEREERLLALGANVVHGHGETFSQLTNVDMKFGKLKDDDGVERDLSQSSFSSFLIQKNPEVRKRAFHQFYAEIQDHQFTLASSLANSVRADVFSARARNYSSARDAALFRDDVPATVYDNLIVTVRANLAPLFHYYELRQRALGLNEIHHYDTYVPMVSDVRTHYTFDEAIDLIVAALKPLGEEYTSVLEKGLRTQRWCDRYENKGKRSGAFSSSSYGNPPYMMMNYKDDVFADIYTLAHEAGHSMHTWFAQNSQTFQDCGYPIFLAEVASTFNEELLTHHLLAQTDDPKMRAYIINRQIDDIRGTVYRQTMFAEFEKLTHEIEERGEPLTLDVFRKVYRGLLDDYFGNNFAIDSDLELECLRIPHFYGGFYVYKYATGISAAVSLSDKVLNGGANDLAAYLGFLKSGGSRFPLPTLLAAGVDMSQPAPIEKTLQLFARRVSELEALLG